MPAMKGRNLVAHRIPGVPAFPWRRVGALLGAGDVLGQQPAWLR